MWSLRAASSLAFVAISAAATAAPAVVIVKIDPTPVERATPLHVLYQVTNPSGADATFQVQVDFNGPRPLQYITLAAGESRVLDAEFLPPAAGSFAAKVTVWEQVGVRVNLKCPTCPIERVPRYGNPVVATRTVAVFDPATPPQRPRESLIGPNGRHDGLDPSGVAGVVAQIRGSRDFLYTVSKHAGVWRSFGGGAWHQLQSGPRHAAVMAVDPTDPRHIVVGERGDDLVQGATSVLDGETGVWESKDGGETWRVIYDPGLDPDHPSNGTYAGIRGVAFGPYGRTIIVATAYGIGVRMSAAANDGFVFPPSARGDISELAVSANGVWAWTAAHVLLMWRDSSNGWRDLAPVSAAAWPAWQQAPIDATVRVTMADDSDTRVVDNVLSDCDGCGPSGLSAFDDMAFLVFHPRVSNSHPDATKDTKCTGAKPAATCAAFGGRLGLLVFDPQAAAPRWRGQLVKDNDGTGLGGRRLTLATTLQCPALPDVVGRRRRLYLVSAQAVQEALALNSDGRFSWDDPVGSRAFGHVEKTDWDGPFGGTSPGIHSDWWDVFLDSTACPPGDIAVWLGTDGGVYRGGLGEASLGTRPNPSFEGALSGLSWHLYTLGLQTHNAHALGVVKPGGAVFPTILYSTQDNDGWWGTSGTTWTQVGTAGDANYADTDGVTTTGMALRDYWPGGVCGGHNCAYLVDFASGAVTGFNVGGRWNGLVSSTIFSFVQTTAAEIQRPSRRTKDLDAVMLVSLPLASDDAGGALGGALGDPAMTPRLALIRNSGFSRHPDGTDSKFADWALERDNLPAGASRFWVTGGHDNPKYFVFTPGSSTCPNGLQGQDGGGAWRCLRTDLALDAGANTVNGPAFVNPYDRDLLLLERLGTTPGLEFSRDGGARFCALPNLTALVTRSGQQPLSGESGNGEFDPARRYSEIGALYHGGPALALAQVAFDRSDPNHVLIVTQSAGVFYGSFELSPSDRRLGRVCTEPVWRAVQPRDANWGYPVGGALLDGTAYLATEGRSVFQVNAPEKGLVATYIQPLGRVQPGQLVATVRDASGDPLPYSRYALRVLGQDGRSQAITARTDEQGHILLPASIVATTITGTPQRLACVIDTLSDGVHAPGHLRFECTPP